MPIEEPYMNAPSSKPGQPSPAMGDKTQEVAGGVMDKARDAAKSQLETGKSRAAGTVSGVAESLREAGHSMDEKSDLPVGQYMHQAAEQLDRLSRTLSEKQPEELLMEAERFARRQPAVFLGLAFATGLIAARFLKSSGGGPTLKDRARDTYESAAAEQTRPKTAAYSGETRVAEPVGEPPAGGW